MRRRSEQRVADGRPAQIVLGCRPPIDCTVVDSSPSGARLLVPPSVYLPATFELVIAGDIHVHATQVWRRRDAIGVRLAGPTARASASTGASTGFGKRGSGY